MALRQMRIVNEKRQRLKGKLMTIAAGLHCREGVLLFADTNVMLSDGARQQGRKISFNRNRFGYFGIANATEDGRLRKPCSRSDKAVIIPTLLARFAPIDESATTRGGTTLVSAST